MGQTQINYTVEDSLLDVLQAPCGPMPRDKTPSISFSLDYMDRTPKQLVGWKLLDFDVKQGPGGGAPTPGAFMQIVRVTKIREVDVAVQDYLTTLLPQARTDPRDSDDHGQYKY
jgi:hypothetical protein